MLTDFFILIVRPLLIIELSYGFIEVFFFPDYDKENTLGVPGQQRMFTPPCHRILPVIFLEELLNEISKESFGGRVLDINKARWLGKHTLHYRGADIAYRIANQTIVEREVLRSVVVSLMSWETYEEDDLDTIIELLSQRSNIIAIQERITDDPADEYHKEKYVAVPKLGTRVRRGPHWTFENQDSEGVGTVVGHGESAGLVFVEWDTGIRFPYIHGREGIYEVVVSDEPRIPEDWFAAVGCFVKRGPDWKWEDQDGGVGSIGTVYRVKDDATVYVRWPCGRSSNYRCGYDGKFDIEICDPFSPQVIQAVKEQQMKAQISDSDEKRCNDLKGKINKEDTTRSVYKPKEVNGSTSDSKVTQDSRRLEKFKPHSPDTTYLSKPGIQKRHMSSGGRHIRNDMVQEDDYTAVTDDIDIQTDSVSEQPPVCKEMRNPDLRTADTKTDCQIEHENIDGFIDCTETFDVLKEFHNDLSVKNNYSSVDKQKQDFFSNNNKTSYHRGAIEEKSSKNNLQNIQHSENRLDNLHRCWQWLDSTGVWIEYPADVNSQINNSLRKRPNASVVIQFQEQSFRVVASKSIQINIESKERTEIRCINSK